MSKVEKIFISGICKNFCIRDGSCAKGAMPVCAQKDPADTNKFFCDLRVVALDKLAEAQRLRCTDGYEEGLIQRVKQTTLANGR